MEYEKSPIATTISRKMNTRSRSLSFSANAVYDGVFTSPANSNSSFVDYSEIFRGSGPSPSSIPFLDVPELTSAKIKVDVRTSKLDYSSVFGGFGVCDFDGSPKDVIVKSQRKIARNEDKRNRRKSGNSAEGRDRISSPEMVRMKHADISYHQAGLRNENGSVQPVPAPTKIVDNVSPLQKIGSKAPVRSVEKETCPVAVNMSPLQKVESKTPVGSIEKETCNVGVEEVKVSRKRSSKTEVDFGEIFGRNGSSACDNSTGRTDSVAEHRGVKPPTNFQRIYTGENEDSERVTGLNIGLSERYQTEDTGSPGSPTFFDAESDVDSSAAESSAALKKALEEAQVRMNIAKQMMEKKKSGFRSSPKPKSCDDPKADDIRDAKVVEEITEESKPCDDPKVDDKSEVKFEEIREESKSWDGPKADDKSEAKVEEITEESRDDNSHILDELVNSSEQSFSNEGDQHAKRARKQWRVPEGLLKSQPDHTQKEVKEQEVVHQEEVKEQEVVRQEEIKEQEAVKQEEEQARRGRKHWELPGGIFKSVMKSKQREPESIAPTKLGNDTKQEVQPLTENPFYTFGQLGSKLKCVVEAFTGSKVSQKDETQVTEKENSFLTQIFYVEDSVSQDMLAGIPVMETYSREMEETPQQTESRSETKIEDNSESTMCTSTEECSQKMELETGWQVKSACESEDEPKCSLRDFQKDPEPSYNFLDQEGEREIITETEEMIVGPDDTKTYVREVEEIPTPSESVSREQVDESVGTIVSFHKENISEPGNIPEEKETEHKAPRRRRVWKTSEDVYNIIKSPIGNNRPWQLESTEKEITEIPFRVEGVRIHDASEETEGTSQQASEETESTSQQASDSGLQENWTVLKQMFRQMFQTEDTKGEDETNCFVESEKDHIDIHKKPGNENGKETTETSYCHMTGADIYEHNAVDMIESGNEAYANVRENEDLEPAQETYRRKEDGKVDVRGKMSLVRELIGEELQAATGMESDKEGEDVQEVFEGASCPQGHSTLDEIKEHADSRAETLEYDGSEIDSNESCEKFEQRRELAHETKIDGSVDTDTSRSSFEMRQGDSYIEEVDVEQDLRDQFHEKYSAASSTEEHIEEIDSDSIQSGWSVIEDEDKIKSYVEESLASHLQDGGAIEQEEKEEAKEDTDIMNTSLGVENNEDQTEQKHQFVCQKEEIDRSNVEPAETSCCLPKGDEKIGAAADRNMKYNDGEESCRSSMEEEGDAASNASQNEAEQADEHLKKKDEVKEKEREREKERVMVERAIREARERAFADARERAGKAAMEKEKAKAHRRGTSEVPKRSEKGSVEVNDKLSPIERASVQAKLRAERAAVERALSEARERALEKALSGKSAASQTRSYGGSKSFGSSGEKRSSPSSQGTENKNSGPSSSSNQTAKGEPIQRCKARSERHQRTSERAAEALAEKKLRDLKSQKEQAERNRLAESLDADVKRWSSGKESNLRALLSTLQYILGAESGWKPIPLIDLVSATAVRKAYRKATLCVHPDKLQQRGASTQQKYICEKVFDLLKEAWDKFGADDK